MTQKRAVSCDTVVKKKKGGGLRSLQQLMDESETDMDEKAQRQTNIFVIVFRLINAILFILQYDLCYTN